MYTDGCHDNSKKRLAETLKISHETTKHVCNNMCRQTYYTIINDISVYRSYTSFTQNLCKKYSKNGTNEICCIRKSHIKKYKKK